VFKEFAIPCTYTLEASYYRAIPEPTLFDESDPGKVTKSKNY